MGHHKSVRKNPASSMPADAKHGSAGNNTKAQAMIHANEILKMKDQGKLRMNDPYDQLQAQALSVYQAKHMNATHKENYHGNGTQSPVALSNAFIPTGNQNSLVQR